MTEPNETLERFAAKACRLYSLPAVAMKVLELTENPQVDTQALKQCIETDPALTGKVLRVVNSSLYGLSREVSDLNQALALLGTKPLKLLVLGFSLPPKLFEGLAGDMLLRYWRHTLVKAVAARELCECFAKRPGDEAFIAGLLQDLGVLLLIQELGEPYVQFLETFSGRDTDITDLEKQSLHFDRTQLSARLLAHWRLPSLLVDAVSLGRNAEPDAGRPITSIRAVLRVAELIARLLADGQRSVLARLLEEAQDLCGLNERQVEDLIGNLEEKVQQLADALSVEVPAEANYLEILAKARERLVEVAEEVAGEIVSSRAARDRGIEGGDPAGEILTTLSETAASAARGPLPPQPATAPQPGNGALAGSPPASRETVPAQVRGRPTLADCAQGSVIASSHLPGPGTSGLAGTSTGSAPLPLSGYVGAAAAACRRDRVPLSLMLVEINDLESLVLTRGRQKFHELRNRLEDACRRTDHPLTACLARGEAGFAVILSDCERQAAVRLGQQLIETVRRFDLPGGMSVGVGVATVSLPAVNFDPDLMLESAARCVYGARTSGGSMVKSIEIY